ncbi:MAG: sulfotransferase [Parvularculaceae bacterium]
MIEQILASHSAVDPAAGFHMAADAEIGRFRSDGVQFPEALRELEPHDEALGRAYIARTKRFRGSRPRFTEQMPNHFALTGLIRLILPNAKVIDARRHPLDSCMGSFKQLFARGQTFTYDLFEIGHYYPFSMIRMMAHWNDVLPGFVHRVDYEVVVLNREEETRKLLAFCGLDFEEQCLDFHKTERAVNTARFEQVRKPIYRDSLQGCASFWRARGIEGAVAALAR